MEAQDIPIDINSGKLLEWLVNRRHCKKDWQVHILKIREKINSAIQDMPEHQEIAKLLSGTHINYFHCKKIIAILKETEADTKNLFGRYGSQRMKDWQEIVRMYEKDNLYLAEASQMLVRNINYEVPSFKKQIQKLDQIQKELEKRESDFKKSEHIACSEFQQLCKQLGITGSHIKKELIERIVELPQIYERIAKQTKQLDNVVEFYNAFVQFTHGKSHSEQCVPLINYIIEKGNTTTYEWMYGEAPLSITEPDLNLSVDDCGSEIDQIQCEDEINVDDLDLNGDIDFGDIQLDEAGAEINWGDIAEDNVSSTEAIDFDISMEESGIIVEATGNDGGNATGTQALKILDNPEIRGDFINQLFELEAFLKLRLYEFKNDNDVNILNMSQLQESPAIQLNTGDTTQTMLDNVEVIISEILDSKVQHLHNIKHSPRYVDVLTSSLKQKQSLIKRMESMQQEMRNKREETRQQVASLKPLLLLVIQKTKELQKEIEQDISLKYKNRKVQLTGGINTL